MSTNERRVLNRFDRRRVVVRMAPHDASLAVQQQFKDECDVNNIIKRAMKGIAPKFVNEQVPQYGDVSEVPDLQRAYELVASAEEKFMQLPAMMRRELDNDPRRLLEAPREMFERYGLMKEAPEAPQEPQGSGSRGEPPGNAPKGQGKAPKAPKQAPKVEPEGEED